MGLEAVEQDPVLGPVLHVAGADLLDGTPIYDIKPYIPYADSLPEAAGGFTDRVERVMLAVDCPPALLEQVPDEKRAALLGVLAQEKGERVAKTPRRLLPPSRGGRTVGDQSGRTAWENQADPDRVYGMSFAGLEVHFTVNGGRLIVTEISGGAAV